MGRLKIQKNIVVYVVLLLIPIAVYWPTGQHQFVSFDDDLYVTDNRYVQNGFSPKSLGWAFTFKDKEDIYWHPLTWLSHMLDCELYGLEAGFHHITSLIIHTLNVLLLFLLFNRMTLNVDSVAWIAERKNLLSTAFWMLTSLCYVYYSRRPGLRPYLLTLLLFCLGLLAKPMLVTLPFVLLLLDYWPLGRFRPHQPRGITPLRLILEKVPFFALSIGSIYVSSLSLTAYKGFISTASVPLTLRIENALVSYVTYMAKMIWPAPLAVFYPYPEGIAGWKVIGAGAVLAGVSALSLWAWRRAPYLLVGWLWFLGTLVPVSGLLQAGLWPAMADRWAYVPLIGLFVMTAWGVPDLLGQWRHRRNVLAASALVFLVGLGICAARQVSHWKNSVTLFSHAVAVTPQNWLAT